MTDPRRQAFAPYLRCLADLMGLKDWRLTIGDAPPEIDGRMAEFGGIIGRKVGCVYLSDRFLNAAPDRQRQTLVHELLHAHHAMLETLVRRSEWEATGMLALEYAIDGIAEAWAERLPLPIDVSTNADYDPVKDQVVPRYLNESGSTVAGYRG